MLITIAIPDKFGQIDANKHLLQINITLESQESLVIVGANGAGKSKFGAWIEKNNKSFPVGTIRRISAQRMLIVPDRVNVLPHSISQNVFTYGEEHSHNNHDTVIARRWNNQPTTNPLNDYQHVLQLIFSDQAKHDREYAKASRQSEVKLPQKRSISDDIIYIWNKVFRQCVIDIDHSESKVSAMSPINGVTYPGSQMSDGERVCLYLIGQCLCVPEHGILIIDEPEIHLHKAILSPLWDAIESKRSDCTFIYITHDLEFAATRTNAKKLWVKEFDGVAWKWDELQPNDDFPEEILFKVIGSRKPVLFVEGNNHSDDRKIYETFFPEHTIIPVDSCSTVIQYTKSLKRLPHLHHWNVYGIVDRDFRDENQIVGLETDNVYFLGVAEQENLFCTEEVVGFMAQLLKFEPIEDILGQVRDCIVGSFKAEIEVQAAKATHAYLERRIASALGKSRHDLTLNDLRAAVNGISQHIDLDNTYSAFHTLYNTLLSQKDWAGILMHFNSKHLLTKVSGIFKQNRREYVRLALSYLREDSATELRDSLRKYLPSLPVQEYSNRQ